VPSGIGESSQDLYDNSQADKLQPLRKASLENTITIRPITTLAEFEAVERMQRVVWGMDDDASAMVPAHLLITAQHHGGVVLGAFAPDNAMMGFVFGFMGTTDDTEELREIDTPYVHCSHMMGVLPEYRKQDVARALKLAQRDIVLSQGLRLAVWTYDPLLSVNAWMNITRLGAICRRYLPNLYGDLPEALNAGLPTDRFEVEWWLDSPHVHRCADSTDSHLDATAWRDAGAQLINSNGPESWQHPVQKRSLLVEIPTDFHALKEADYALALQWRLHIREIFQWAFTRTHEDHGYTVVSVARESSDGILRTYYVLSPANWTDHLK
jgi:predicted GNAT superfamily acetyltransferase